MNVVSCIFQPVTFESYNSLISGLGDIGEQLQKFIGDIVPQLLSIDLDGLKIDDPFQVNIFAVYFQDWQKCIKSMDHPAL